VVALVSSKTADIQNKLGKMEKLERNINLLEHKQASENLVRRKRFVLPPNPNLLNLVLFPTGFFPTNFIGLQVTLPAPKIN